MNDLFKKLNVLIKANLNDVVSHDDGETRPRVRLGKNVDAEIDALRERINDAVKYEDELKARIGQFADEAARWDQQADEAVTQGNDASARYAIEQMQRAQQRQIIAEADLRDHQRTTQDLIQRVNMLDAVVADARRAQPEEPAPAASSPLPDLGNVLRETREKIANLSETAAKGDLAPPAADSPADAAAVDDDLARRRDRLSKR